MPLAASARVGRGSGSGSERCCGDGMGTGDIAGAGDSTDAGESEDVGSGGLVSGWARAIPWNGETRGLSPPSSAGGAGSVYALAPPKEFVREWARCASGDCGGVSRSSSRKEKSSPLSCRNWVQGRQQTWRDYRRQMYLLVLLAHERKSICHDLARHVRAIHLLSKHDRERFDLLPRPLHKICTSVNAHGRREQETHKRQLRAPSSRPRTSPRCA